MISVGVGELMIEEGEVVGGGVIMGEGVGLFFWGLRAK